MAFDSQHYQEVHKSVKATVLKYIEPSFFANKSVISIGEGGGDYARWLQDLSANVLATDGHPQNVSDLSGQVFPVELFDANTAKLSKGYDLCWHVYVLNMLSKFDDHLADVCKNCNFLILQAEVMDSDDAAECAQTGRLSDRRDQSLEGTGTGTIPSPAYVEAILTANGMHFKRINDADLNTTYDVDGVPTTIYRYDWTCTNTKNYCHWNDPAYNIASFWICWKDGQANPIVANLQ
jgi:hypothetical protein